MEHFAEHRERVERNLATKPLDTIRAMAEVEGPGWFSAQERMERGAVSDGDYETSFPYALERVQEGKTATIYGKGGINRWYVEADGGVSFSETHARSPEHVSQARQLGFEVVP